MIEDLRAGLKHEDVTGHRMEALASMPVLIWHRSREAYADHEGQFTASKDDAKRWSLARAYIASSQVIDARLHTYQPCDFIALDLPMPPSTNALFVEAAGKRKGSGRQRVKTAAYRAWSVAATFALKPQLRAQGAPPAPDTPIFDKHWAIWIRVNLDHGSDITNRIKALEDLLVEWKVTCGDQWDDRCTIERDRSLPSGVECRAIVYRKVQ